MLMHLKLIANGFAARGERKTKQNKKTLLSHATVQWDCMEVFFTSSPDHTTCRTDLHPSHHDQAHDCIIGYWQMWGRSVVILFKMSDLSWLPIRHRSGYVTPLVTGSRTFHSDQCTIDFVWRSIWSWVRTRKRDPVDMEIIRLHVTLWWRIGLIRISDHVCCCMCPFACLVTIMRSGSQLEWAHRDPALHTGLHTVSPSFGWGFTTQYNSHTVAFCYKFLVFHAF